VFEACRPVRAPGSRVEEAADPRVRALARVAPFSIARIDVAPMRTGVTSPVPSVVGVVSNRFPRRSCRIEVRRCFTVKQWPCRLCRPTGRRRARCRPCSGKPCLAREEQQTLQQDVFAEPGTRCIVDGRDSTSWYPASENAALVVQGPAASRRREDGHRLDMMRFRTRALLSPLSPARRQDGAAAHDVRSKRNGSKSGSGEGRAARSASRVRVEIPLEIDRPGGHPFGPASTCCTTATRTGLALRRQFAEAASFNVPHPNKGPRAGACLPPRPTAAGSGSTRPERRRRPRAPERSEAHRQPRRSAIGRRAATSTGCSRGAPRGSSQSIAVRARVVTQADAREGSPIGPKGSHAADGPAPRRRRGKSARYATSAPGQHATGVAQSPKVVIVSPRQ